MHKDCERAKEKMKIGDTAGAAYFIVVQTFYHESPLLFL